MKNIDKIRKMNSDELAEFFYDLDRCSTIECSECSVKKILPKLCGRTTFDSYKQFFASIFDNG